jgi:hypothetical protein
MCWIHSQIGPHLRVKKSPIAGRGLFASRWDYTSKGRTKHGFGSRVLFQPRDRICSYVGDVIDKTELRRRYPSGTPHYVFTDDDHRFIDSRDTTSCFGRFANWPPDGQRPNAKIQRAGRQAEVVAIQPIRQGQEILVNYSSKGKHAKLTYSDDEEEARNNKDEDFIPDSDEQPTSKKPRPQRARTKTKTYSPPEIPAHKKRAKDLEEEEHRASHPPPPKPTPIRPPPLPPPPGPHSRVPPRPGPHKPIL